MIQDFTHYLSESKSAPRKNMYTVLTAIAVFNPGSLSFLNAVKNRYTLTSQEVNLSLYHALVGIHTLTLIFEPQPADFTFDLNRDWSRMQKCVKSALAIHREFVDVDAITIHADDSLSIETGEGTRKVNTKQAPTNKADLYALVGIEPEQVLASNAFTMLVNQWLRALEQALKPEYVAHLRALCPTLEVSNFTQFKGSKLKGLGVRVEAMPKLYYTSVYLFSLDVLKVSAAFHNLANFLDRWREIIDLHLNRELLLPALQGTKQRGDKFATVLGKVLSLDQEAYFRFDANQQLYQVSAAGSFHGENEAAKLSQKYYINKNRELILKIQRGTSGTLKIMVGMESLAPSPLKIQYRYEKEQGS